MYEELREIDMSEGSDDMIQLTGFALYLTNLFRPLSRRQRFINWIKRVLHWPK